jgi:hypothetical protein
MVLRLKPRRASTIVYAEAKENNLVEFIDAFVKLKEESLIHNWLMITNKNDPRTTDANQFNYTGDWSAIFCFYGTEEIREICKKEIQKRLSKLCDNLFFLNSTIEKDKAHPYFSILQELYNEYPLIIVLKQWHN